MYRRTDAGQFPYFIGTFGDYIYLAPGHPVFRTPDELSDLEVAPANCAYGTVLQGLRRADVRVDQHIVVQGCGGLGLATIGMAHEIGAATITAIDGQAPRLAMAREFGATHTIDIAEYASADDRVARVREITGDHGADLVVELVGLGELLTEGSQCLARVVRSWRSATSSPAQAPSSNPTCYYVDERSSARLCIGRRSCQK